MHKLSKEVSSLTTPTAPSVLPVRAMRSLQTDRTVTTISPVNCLGAKELRLPLERVDQGGQPEKSVNRMERVTFHTVE